MLGAALHHIGFMVTEFCMKMDIRKCKMWDQMKTANAIMAVWSEEMGLKKTSKVFEVPRGHSITMLTARRQI